MQQRGWAVPRVSPGPQGVAQISGAGVVRAAEPSRMVRVELR